MPKNVAGSVSSIAILALCLTVQNAQAQRSPPTKNARADVFEKVMDCRAITDDTRRLACYDNSVAAFDAAEKANQVVVMDRTQVRAARRSLFGFSLPKIKLFSGSDNDQDQIQKIDTSVASFSSDADGRLIFATPEGASWRQIDDRPTFPKRGMKVTIQKAALGSYFARFEGTTSVKVIRIR